MSDRFSELSPSKIIFYSLIIGLALRITIGIPYTYPIEDNYWILASTNFTAGQGLYGLPGYYYFPSWGYVLSIITFVANKAGIGYGHYGDFGTAIKDCDVVIPSLGYSTLFLIVLIILDVLVGYLIYRIGCRITTERRAAIMFAVWFLCPITIMMSSVRLMFENFEIMLMLLALLFMMDRKNFVSGLFMGTCLLSKQFGVFMAVLMSGYSYAHSHSLRGILEYFLGILVSVAVLMFPILLMGDLAESLHWLTSRMDSGVGSSGGSLFNVNLILMPLLGILTLFSAYHVARSKEENIGTISLLALLPLVVMLILAGNVQYYLFVLPFLVLALNRWTMVPTFFMLSVLGIMSLICFITTCSSTFVDSGFFGADVIESITSWFSPAESHRTFYEHWKMATGAVLTIVVAGALYFRYRGPALESE